MDAPSQLLDGPPAQIADDRFPAGCFPHGPFLVEPDGAMHPTRPPALRFRWRGRPCEARIEDGRVSLTIAAGAVPYTAERPGARPGALAAVDELPAALPKGWRLRVLPDHRLLLESTDDLPAPTTAIALVSAMVGFALALDGYLDRLESAGVEAGAVEAGAGEAGAATGTAKT